LGPETLAQVLRPLQEMFNEADYPDLLIGLGVPDDAAVYRLDDERALVATTDFFTPIVDDPYAYGAIAAANALSDVYAVGGRPLLALNVAALPATLAPETIAAIFRGGAEKVREAGAVIAGGHSIQDNEPKVGLVVIGMAHPQQLLTKGAAAPGDVLVLTKPLGTGCITTAAKADRAAPEHIEEATRWMCQLNRAACEAARCASARAATDVTGFGLAGHAIEMANASRVTIRLQIEAIPLMDGAADYAAQGIFPGGSANNRRTFQPAVRIAPNLSEPKQMLLFDAQTSGGLLVSLPPERLDVFTAEMDRANEPWWQIGTVADREDVSIVVTR